MATEAARSDVSGRTVPLAVLGQMIAAVEPPAALRARELAFAGMRASVAREFVGASEGSFTAGPHTAVRFFTCEEERGGEFEVLGILLCEQRYLSMLARYL